MLLGWYAKHQRRVELRAISWNLCLKTVETREIITADTHGER